MPQQSIRRSHYDAIVIGARCAGAATGLLLARAGLDVLIVDKGREGADALSTHALMRTGVQQLARLGVLDEVRAAGTPPVRRATFHYGEREVQVDIPPRDGIDALFAPRRTVLDPVLVEAARAAGAEVHHHTGLDALQRDSYGRVCGVHVTDRGGSRQSVDASIVIGADGLRSAVAAAVSAPVQYSFSNRTTCIYRYFEGVELDGYHWAYREGAAAGLIPTNGGLCVFVSMPPASLQAAYRQDLETGFWAVLRRVVPALAARLGRAVPSPYRVFLGAPGLLRGAWGPGWALVGDAGYFKDPLTAHGISDALRDAELLASAVLEGGARALDDYQCTRDALSLRFLELTDRIASFGWDLDELATLHRAAAREMSVEAQVMHDRGVPARRAA